MSIPFTQFLLPDGRRVQTEVDMSAEIEALAHRFIDAGGWYECEMLGDYKHVSLTACWNQSDGENDIAIELVENGPSISNGVEMIVIKSIKWLDESRGVDPPPAV